MKGGRRYINFGTGSLSIAAGVDDSTVAGHLRTLRTHSWTSLRIG